MSEIDVSGIKVQVLDVYQHSWASGRTLDHVSPPYSRAQFQYHLWLIEDGSVDFDTSTSHFNVGRNECCLLPFTTPRFVYTGEPATWMSLHIKITVFNNFDLMRHLTLPAKWRLQGEELGLMHSWMKIIVRDFYRQPSHISLKVQGLAQSILGLNWPHLTSDTLSSSIHSGLPQWLGQILLRISQDPACSIAALAHDCGFSQAQFRRLFHQHLGCAPREYLINKRLEKASNYLMQTDLSLREISTIVGWRDVAHFSRLFSANYGMTPSQYRHRNRTENTAGAT